MTTLGTMLYGLRPTMAVGSFDHSACTLGQFCRNPLHPGPCKGWKRKLGIVSPGALHAIERARADKLEERRKAKVEALQKAGQPVPKRLQNPIKYDPNKSRHLTAPSPDLTPEQARKALPPTSQQIGQKIAARRAAQAAPATPATPAGPAPSAEATKAAEFSGELMKFLGVDAKKVDGAKDALAAQYQGWIDRGDNARIKAASQMFADKIVNQVEKASGSKFAPGTPLVRSALDEEIEDRLRGGGAPTPILDVVLGGGDTDAVWQATLDKTRAKAAAKKAATAQKAAATRAANKAAKAAAPAAPAKAAPNTPAAPAKAAPSAPASGSKVAGLSTERLVQGVKIHGSVSGQGKEAAEELRRRGLDLDGKPLAAPSAPAPAKTAPAAAPNAPAKAAPAAPSGPTPAAPLPATASPALKHAQAVAHRSAPGSALAKNHVTAYEPVSKAEFDTLPAGTQKQILADLEAAKGKFLDPKKQAAAQKLIDRFEPSTGRHTPTATGNAPIGQSASPPKAGPAPAPSAPTANTAPASPFRNEVDDLHSKLKAGATDSALAIDSLAHRAERGSAEDKAHFETFRKAVEDDASLPGWIRAAAAVHGAEYKKAEKSLGSGSSARMAVYQAVRKPSRFPTTYDFQEAMAGDRAEISKLPSVVQEAVRARREEIARVLLDTSANSNPSKARETVVRALFPFGKPLDTGTYYEFDANTRAQIRDAIQKQSQDYLRTGSAGLASEYQSMLDKIDGKRFLAQQEAAIDTLRSNRTFEGKLPTYEALAPNDVTTLPTAHREAIIDAVEKGRNHYDQSVAIRSRDLLARWSGTLPTYPSNVAYRAATAADLHKDLLTPEQRLGRYASLGKDSWGALSASDKAKVTADVATLTNGSALTLRQRYSLQEHFDGITNATGSYPKNGLDAAYAADPSPGNNASVDERLDAYRKLTRSDYQALPKPYREAIDADLEYIKNFEPAAYSYVKSIIDPTYTPPAAPKPTPPAAPGNTAAMTSALNVLYGIDPKANTTARQLQVYGTLRKSEFDLFNAAEQSTLLGDLSYIETTSKVAKTRDRARELLDRFTPAGTPSGAIPNQPVYPPASSVTGQTRLPDPDGTPGLLKKATNPGQSGDGWLRLPNGKTGPWGKYGAAGLLLRHVDPNDGRERYLMVQRGPGISDPGKWQFPGGAIDSNETPYEGGAREVIEELGFKDGDLLAGRVHGFHEFAMPGTSWKYTSIAATMPTQLKPDLSTHHARQETSDAKWMTIEEIRALDTKGKLLKPLAGGAMESNVVSLFPQTRPAVARPGPTTRRPGRIAGTPVVPTTPAAPAPHKPSLGKDLVATAADQDKLRADVKAVRKNYRGKAADERLAAIAAMQGFDDTPNVVPQAEFDRLLATGDYIEAWRGVMPKAGKTAAAINEDYRTGTAFFGLGVVGNGYYFATDKAIARKYSDGTSGGLLRVLLPKGAKIIKWQEARDRSQNATSSTYFYQQGRSGMGGGTLHDEGRWAAAAGYDAIEVPASKYRQVGGSGNLATGPVYVILNRSVTIAQEG